jgi:hypothetical protein
MYILAEYKCARPRDIITLYKGGKLNLHIGQANLIFIHYTDVNIYPSGKGGGEG